MDKECEQKDEMSQESVKTEGGRLMRDPQHGVLGGVLAGVADYTHVNSVVLRLVFVFLFMFGGAFVILMGVYLLAWLLMPQKREPVVSEEMVGQDEAPLAGIGGSPLSKGLKLGCLCVGGTVAFVILIFALLLVVPSIYLSDFIHIISDLDDGAFDAITFNVQYTPDIPQLVIGALIVFVMPIWYLVRLRKTNEERDTEGRSLFWILLLVWMAGIFMIISSLTNNREDFERSDVDNSFFNVNFEQNKI
ncbi:MAG: PspC domain-containing protein [Paludibacteraceae bacterium]|nr:PspC domain-containing protein [Prevotellaceae bacterium]